MTSILTIAVDQAADAGSVGLVRDKMFRIKAQSRQDQDNDGNFMPGLSWATVIACSCC